MNRRHYQNNLYLYIDVNNTYELGQIRWKKPLWIHHWTALISGLGFNWNVKALDSLRFSTLHDSQQT